MNDIEKKLLEIFDSVAPGHNISKENMDNPIIGGESGIDSLKFVELIVEIEERFGIVFDEVELSLETLNSFRALSGLVFSKVDKIQFL